MTPRIEILPLVEFTDGTFEPVSEPVYGSNDSFFLDGLGSYKQVRGSVYINGEWVDRPIIAQKLPDLTRHFIKRSDL